MPSSRWKSTPRWGRDFMCGINRRTSVSTSDIHVELEFLALFLLLLPLDHGFVTFVPSFRSSPS